jgi:hypothetical protein
LSVLLSMVWRGVKAQARTVATPCDEAVKRRREKAARRRLVEGIPERRDFAHMPA